MSIESIYNTSDIIDGINRNEKLIKELKLLNINNEELIDDLQLVTGEILIHSDSEIICNFKGILTMDEIEELNKFIT